MGVEKAESIALGGYAALQNAIGNGTREPETNRRSFPLSLFSLSKCSMGTEVLQPSVVGGPVKVTVAGGNAESITKGSEWANGERRGNATHDTQNDFRTPFSPSRQRSQWI